MNRQTYRAFAPASVSNLNVGFDILGYPLDSLGDTVSVTKLAEKKVIIKSIRGASINLPTEPEKNSAGLPLVRLIRDKNLDFGFEVEIEKGIPVGSGLGGSAASAVAAVLAANGHLDVPLTFDELVEYSLIGEEIATGQRHGDNVVPCLSGGLCLMTSLNPLKVFKLPIPNIIAMHFHPQTTIKTSEARTMLSPEVLLTQHIFQQKQLAGFISGLYKNDTSILRDHFEDKMIEPQRSDLIPGLTQAKKIAKNLGAIGFGISGSGPTLFCWLDPKADTSEIKKRVTDELLNYYPNVNCWTDKISSQGGRLI